MLLRTVLLIFIATPLFALSEPLRVAIDAGHGGRDSGATAFGLQESHLVLDLSKRVASKLSQDPRFQVILTREKKSFLPLADRVSKAHITGADILISIHANSSPDPRAKGLEVYFQNQLPPDEETMFLANLENTHHDKDNNDRKIVPKKRPRHLNQLSGDVENIVSDLIRTQRIRESGELSRAIAKSWGANKKSTRNTIRQAPFFVVSNTEIPSILVEIGFVTNQREAKSLKNEAYKNLIANSLYKGIIRYKESLDK